MNIVMMGTGTFAEPTFETLLKAFPNEVVGLVTQPAREVGRRSGSSRQTGVGMATIAQAHSIPVIQPESINSPEGLAQLAAVNPDLLVVAAYGQILKPSVLAIPRLGAINVHASLLPKYRGAAPVAHAILNGETETGVTIIRITLGLDAGEMLAKAKIAIKPDETTGELEARLSPLGAQLAAEVVKKLKRDPLNGEKQDAALVTKAPKITKEKGLIDWTLSASRIENHIRAMQPWPTAYTFLHHAFEEPLRIIVCSAGNPSYRPTFDPGPDPGEIASDLSRMVVECGMAPGRTALQIFEVQPAGKRRMRMEEFLRGHPLPPGSRFGPEQL